MDRSFLATHRWKGHTIDIYPHPSERVGDEPVGVVVGIDGQQEFFPSTRLDCDITQTRFEIEHNGETIVGLVNAHDKRRASTIPYDLVIDDMGLPSGRVHIE